MSISNFLKNTAVFICGVVFAFNITMLKLTPLPTSSVDKYGSYTDISDHQKREFFTATFQTFQYGNPRNEKHDWRTSSKPSDEELFSYYRNFDQIIKRVHSQGCPKKEVVLLSRWADIDAEDRIFNVFDIEKCTETKGNYSTFN